MPTGDNESQYQGESQSEFIPETHDSSLEYTDPDIPNENPVSMFNSEDREIRNQQSVLDRYNSPDIASRTGGLPWGPGSYAFDRWKNDRWANSFNKLPAPRITPTVLNRFNQNFFYNQGILIDMENSPDPQSLINLLHYVFNNKIIVKIGNNGRVSIVKKNDATFIQQEKLAYDFLIKLNDPTKNKGIKIKVGVGNSVITDTDDYANNIIYPNNIILNKNSIYRTNTSDVIDPQNIWGLNGPGESLMHFFFEQYYGQVELEDFMPESINTDKNTYYKPGDDTTLYRYGNGSRYLIAHEWAIDKGLKIFGHGWTIGIEKKDSENDLVDLDYFNINNNYIVTLRIDNKKELGARYGFFIRKNITQGTLLNTSNRILSFSEWLKINPNITDYNIYYDYVNLYSSTYFEINKSPEYIEIK